MQRVFGSLLVRGQRRHDASALAEADDADLSAVGQRLDELLRGAGAPLPDASAASRVAAIEPETSSTSITSAWSRGTASTMDGRARLSSSDGQAQQEQHGRNVAAHARSATDHFAQQRQIGEAHRVRLAAPLRPHVDCGERGHEQRAPSSAVGQTNVIRVAPVPVRPRPAGTPSRARVDAARASRKPPARAAAGRRCSEHDWSTPHASSVASMRRVCSAAAAAKALAQATHRAVSTVS